MKKIVLICFCGLGFILKGMSTETVHCKNIEYAITQFSSTMTNDIQSMEHDFIAILGEIKDLNSKVARINLLTNLANRLCAVSKDIWKCKNAYSYQWDRICLMDKAMFSLGEGNFMFKWRRYLDLLQAIKMELASYEDVKHPDAYRDKWIAFAEEDLKRKIKELGTTSNIIISGPVSMSEEEREIRAKWAYKRRLIFEIKEYEKTYFDSLKLQDDYRKLPKEEQKKLMEMVKEGLGRYPKWYREDPVEKR